MIQYKRRRSEYFTVFSIDMSSLILQCGCKNPTVLKSTVEDIYFSSFGLSFTKSIFCSVMKPSNLRILLHSFL